MASSGPEAPEADEQHDEDRYEPAAEPAAPAVRDEACPRLVRRTRPLPVEEERREQQGRAFESQRVRTRRPGQAGPTARRDCEHEESRCAADGEPRLVRPVQARPVRAEASDRENEDDRSGREASERRPTEPERQAEARDEQHDRRAVASDLEELEPGPRRSRVRVRVEGGEDVGGDEPGRQERRGDDRRDAQLGELVATCQPRAEKRDERRDSSDVRPGT